MKSSWMLAWALGAGLVTNIGILSSPDAWQYAGLMFGAALAGYFTVGFIKAHTLNVRSVFKVLILVTAAAVSYRLIINVAAVMIAASGFTSSASYSSSAAVPALYAAFFVGGCIGSFVLAVILRMFFFRFNVTLGLFIFFIVAAQLGAVIAIGFETFGFTPQFAIPLIDVGLAATIAYLYDSGQAAEVAAEKIPEWKD